MMYLSVKDRLVSELGKSFHPKLHFETRVKVLSDLLLFKPKEDISVWRQKLAQHRSISPFTLMMSTSVDLMTRNQWTMPYCRSGKDLSKHTRLAQST